MSFKYTAVDSIMIHICIYIFTINHFVDTFLKKTLITSLFLLLNGPEALPHLWWGKFVPWLSLFLFPRKLKCGWWRTRSRGNAHVILSVAERLLVTLRKNKSCHWAHAGFAGISFINFLSHRFIAIKGLRVVKKKQTENWRTPTHWITNKSLINALHFLLLNPVSGGLIPVGTEWFHPTDCL